MNFETDQSIMNTGAMNLWMVSDPKRKQKYNYSKMN